MSAEDVTILNNLIWKTNLIYFLQKYMNYKIIDIKGVRNK